MGEEWEASSKRTNKQLTKLVDSILFFSLGQCIFPTDSESDAPIARKHRLPSCPISVPGFLKTSFSRIGCSKIGRGSCNVHFLTRKGGIWPATKLMYSENKRDGPIKSRSVPKLSLFSSCARTSLFSCEWFFLENPCGVVVISGPGQIFVFMQMKVLRAYVLLSHVTI